MRTNHCGEHKYKMENTTDRDIQDIAERLFDAIVIDGKIEEVEEIFSKEKVDINVIHRGGTPLIWAAEDGRLDIVRRLLQVQEMKLAICGYTIRNTALYYASSNYNKISIL